MSIKRQVKTISPFNVVLNWLVCLQPDWIPHGMSPQTHPLSTTDPLKLIETYLYTQRQSPNPKFIYKAVLGANRRQHTLTGSRRFFSPCMISSQSGAKPLFRQCLERQNCFHLTLSRHQIIKTSLCTISKNS